MTGKTWDVLTQNKVRMIYNLEQMSINFRQSYHNDTIIFLIISQLQKNGIAGILHSNT